MNDLKPMVCECCGGHIDRITLDCKWCGSKITGGVKEMEIT